MSSSERRRIAERILEDPTLTGDLIDPAARFLLEWGVRRAERIMEHTAGQGQEDAARQLALLRHTIRRINALAGQVPPAEQLQRVQTLLNNIERPEESELDEPPL